MVQMHGLQEIGVQIIREMRDAEPRKNKLVAG
jgi:hypothetical protein